MNVEHRAAAIVAAVPDPELPFLTIGDLGMVRSVAVDGAHSRVTVAISPAFVGCPATDAIVSDIRAALTDSGFTAVDVRIELSPPWSSDLITQQGRAKLADAGIAPPACLAASTFEAALDAPVACPLCHSLLTRRTGEFGATPCRMTYVCASCREPFEAIKPI